MVFKDITTVDLQLQMQVREWRNHIDIRKNMYTDNIITEQEHEAWIESLLSNQFTKVFIAYHKDDAIGLVLLTNINTLHKSADWAFYLNPDFLTKKGLGTLMEYYFLTYSFDNFDIEKLNCEVLEINPSVIKLHKKFGFMEEGVFRKNILKNDKRIDVYRLGILKEEWYQIKDKFIKIIERVEK